MQHMHHHANYMHRPPEMASLPAAPTAATPGPSRCENPHNNNKKDNKKKKNKSSSDEKRVRKSRSEAEDQPEATRHQPKRPTTGGPQQFISFGMAPPQQLTTPSMDVDGESMVSGYIYTGMDRDIAEEFILHSMTIPAQATGSVKSGATDKREMFWMPKVYHNVRPSLLYN